MCHSTGTDVCPNVTSQRAVPRIGIGALLYGFNFVFDGVIFDSRPHLLASFVAQTDTFAPVSAVGEARWLFTIISARKSGLLDLNFGFHPFLPFLGSENVDAVCLLIIILRRSILPCLNALHFAIASTATFGVMMAFELASFFFNTYTPCRKRFSLVLVHVSEVELLESRVLYRQVVFSHCVLEYFPCDSSANQFVGLCNCPVKVQSLRRKYTEKFGNSILLEGRDQQQYRTGPSLASDQEHLQ